MSEEKQALIEAVKKMQVVLASAKGLKKEKVGEGKTKEESEKA